MANGRKLLITWGAMWGRGGHQIAIKGAMQCLWPKRGSTVAIILALLPAVVVIASADVIGPSRPSAFPSSLMMREQNLRHVPAHSSEFAPVYMSAAATACGISRPPEALLTPDPDMQDFSDDLHVRVSFIVGADGRVHSAFVLKSGGRAQDDEIMQAVRRWRYRPALCNGVPTPMEAQVSFMPR